MASKKIRIRLKAYDYRILDVSVEKIIAAVKNSGATVVGPIPLPTEKQVYTILRAVHKYKDAREQFEIRTHKRLIDIVNPNKQTIDTLTHLVLISKSNYKKGAEYYEINRRKKNGYDSSFRSRWNNVSCYRH